MKITRSEKDINFIPETEWEYEQLEILLHKSIQTVGFDNPWEESWQYKGGLKIKFLDPYN